MTNEMKELGEEMNIIMDKIEGLNEIVQIAISIYNSYFEKHWKKGNDESEFYLCLLQLIGT